MTIPFVDPAFERSPVTAWLGFWPQDLEKGSAFDSKQSKLGWPSAESSRSFLHGALQIRLC
jgi:hypothetical protein